MSAGTQRTAGDEARTGGLKGRHVLFALLGFFGAIVAVNGVFLYHAVTTFNGFAATDAYRKGLRYNEAIAQSERMARQGWQAALDYDRPGGRLLLRVSDRAGAPVAGLRIEATLSRPVTDREDRRLDFAEIAPSVYAASLSIGFGQWIVAAALYTGDDGAEAAHRLRQRLWVSARP